MEGSEPFSTNITIVKSGIERLLDEQRDEGTVESAGTFMVNLEQAKKKSLRFGAESPDKAILKLAQALVCGTPSFIDIKLKSDRLTVEVDGAHRLLKDVKFLQGDLGRALWSCVYSGFLSVRATIRGHSWLLQKSGVEEGETKPNEVSSDTLVFELRFAVPSGFWGNIRALIRGRNTATFALSSHLRHCPVPTKLDSRLLNASQYRPKAALDIFLTGSNATLSEEICPLYLNSVKGQFTFIKDRRFGSERNDHTTSVKVTRPARATRFGFKNSWRTLREGSLLAHLWVPRSKMSNPKLLLIKNGVLVGERPFLIPAVASAGGLDLDASGLAVVENKKLEELETYLRYSATREWKRVRELELSAGIRSKLQVLKG